MSELGILCRRFLAAYAGCVIISGAILTSASIQPSRLSREGYPSPGSLEGQSPGQQVILKLLTRPAQIVPGAIVTILGADFGAEAGGRRLFLQLSGQPGKAGWIPLKVERWSPQAIEVRVPKNVSPQTQGAFILLLSSDNRVLGRGSVTFAAAGGIGRASGGQASAADRSSQVDPRASGAQQRTQAELGAIPGAAPDRGQLDVRKDALAGRNPIRKALVLSGGGAKGAFQLGVLKHLYEQRRFNPGIITATSVGSLNGAKLAEGPEAIRQLEGLWRGIKSSQDIYQPNPQVAEFQNRVQKDLEELKNDISLLMAGSMTFSWFFYGVDMTYQTDPYLMDRWLGRAGQIEYLNVQNGLYKLIDERVNVKKIADSGIRLSVATVSRDSGELRFIDGDGRIFSADGTPLNIGGRSQGSTTILSGIRASSAIPLFFKPELIAGENYWDGAIREDIPVRRALQLGATELTIILCSPRKYRPAPLAGLPSEADIGPITNTMHAMDILADQVAQDDLATTLSVLDLLREIGWNALRNDISRVQSFPLPRENQNNMVFTIPTYKVIEPPVVVGSITDFVPEVIDVNIRLGEMVARFSYSANRNEREERRQVRALIAENERNYRTQYERFERFAENAPERRQEQGRRRLVAPAAARAFRLWKVFEKALKELDAD
jgi:NTE family protein